MCATLEQKWPSVGGSPPPRPGMVYGSYPPPPLWWWKGAYLLITTFTYLLSYLVTYLLLHPAPPCGGGRVLTYLVTCLIT